MSRNQIPTHWQTDRFTVQDNQLSEADALQEIEDAEAHVLVGKDLLEIR